MKFWRYQSNTAEHQGIIFKPIKYGIFSFLGGDNVELNRFDHSIITQ